MNGDSADDGGSHIEPCIDSEDEDPVVHQVCIIEPDREERDRYADDEGPEPHPSGIELYLFLVTCAYTGDDDKHERCELAVVEVSILIDEPSSCPFMYISYYPVEEVEHIRCDGILEELQYE